MCSSHTLCPHEICGVAFVVVGLGGGSAVAAVARVAVAAVARVAVAVARAAAAVG